MGRQQARFLTRHPNGQWCKRIGGKVTYLGTDYENALVRWYEHVKGHGMGVALQTICLRWLEWKEGMALSPRTLEGYRWAVGRIADGFGPTCKVHSMSPLTVEQWLDGLGVGVWRRRHALMVLKACISWGSEMGMCERPRGFGLWKGPSERELRGACKGAVHVWTTDEVLALVGSGDKRGRLMALLGINLGYGMADMCSHVQLMHGGEWVGGPRVKTGVPRLGWLWPETRRLMVEVGEPPLGRGRARHLYRFWNRHVEAVGLVTGGRGHYDLRATLRMLMGEVGDVEAARLVMGHEHPGVERFYLRQVAKERVRSLLQAVRSRILPSASPVP